MSLPSPTASASPIDSPRVDRGGRLASPAQPSVVALIGRARRRTRFHRLGVAAAATGWVMAAGMVARGTFGTSVGLALFIAVSIGVAAFLRRRPSDLDLLGTIDRRLRLHDLLTSAATVVGEADGVRLVRAEADRVAATVDVRAVFDDPAASRRLTTAGVALAASVALAFTVSPRGVASKTPDVVVPIVESRAGGDVGRATPPSPRRDPANASTGASVGGERSTLGDAASRGRLDGVGVAAGRSPAAPMSIPRAAGEASKTANDAGGLASGETKSVGHVANARSDATAAAATLGVAPADVDLSRATSADDARRAIDDGRVPAASRDLVRAFFAPEGRP